MIRNFILIAWRRLLRERHISLIHIIGLASGISAAILIFLYVESELAYDKHHQDAELIYRVNSVLELDGQVDRVSRNSMRALPELTEQYPEIASYCRVLDIGKQTAWYGDKVFSQEGVAFTDSTYFQFFDYKFIAGEGESCLNQPNMMAIDRPTAEKFFGSAEDAIGKALKFSRRDYQVNAVFEAPEQETQLPYTMLIAMSSLDRTFYANTMQDYFRMICFGYIKLQPQADVLALNDKFESFYTGSIEPWIKQNEVNGMLNYALQPLTEVHLSNEYSYDFAGNSNRNYLSIFGVVGIFLLVIAAINYMNLSTARAGKRSKEIGIRMVAGASRKQLILQFLLEAVLHTFLAMLLALSLVELLLPFFNSLTDKHFGHSQLFEGQTLVMMTLLCLGLALISGSYPAFFLSGFRAAQVINLKGQSKNGIQGWKKYFSPVYLRRILVITQFSISIALIVGTLVVESQFEFMKNKDLGFDKNNVLVIPVPGDTAVQGNLKTIRNELSSRPEVASIASSSEVPGGQYGKLYFIVDHESNRANKILGFSFIDEHFIDLMNIKLEGRNFDPANSADQRGAFIINQACADFLGWKEPIGKEMENGFGMRGRVIGVVENFNFSSLHNPIEPMVMMYQPNNARNLLIKMKGNEEVRFDGILDQWKTMVPNHPLEAYYLDDFMNRNYIKEGKMLQVFSYFTILAVFISCLGLFGLASYSTALRTKEIGIRKVLGASAGNIIFQLTREFILLVILANFIAWPIAAYYLRNWLDTFAFPIDLSSLPFIGAALAALLVAALTVSGISWRAASSNPVKALRYE